MRCRGQYDCNTSRTRVKVTLPAKLWTETRPYTQGCLQKHGTLDGLSFFLIISYFILESWEKPFTQTCCKLYWLIHHPSPCLPAAHPKSAVRPNTWPTILIKDLIFVSLDHTISPLLCCANHWDATLLTPTGLSCAFKQLLFQYSITESESCL